MNHKLNRKYGRGDQHNFRYCLKKSDVAVLLVPGGGWIGTSMDAANFNNGEAIRFVSEQYGISVGICTYTLATADKPTAQITRDNPRYNRPPNNVMVAAWRLKQLSGAKYLTILGSSAGSEIAALAYSYYPDVIDRFVGFYGAYNLTQPKEFSRLVRGMIKTYTGNRLDKKIGSSPVFDKNFPKKKYLLFHGSADRTIYPIQSARMQLAHPQGELVVVPGKAHGGTFKPFGTEKESPEYMARLLKFFHTGK